MAETTMPTPAQETEPHEAPIEPTPDTCGEPAVTANPAEQPAPREYPSFKFIDHVLPPPRMPGSGVLDKIAEINGMKADDGWTEGRKNRVISKIVLEDLQQHGGKFLRTGQGRELYFDPVKGRLLDMGERDSAEFEAMVQRRYGMNRTEKQCAFVLQELRNFVRIEGTVKALQRIYYFDRETFHLYAYLGNRKVAVLDGGETIYIQPHGHDGVYFVEPIEYEPVNLDLEVGGGSKWFDTLFLDGLIFDESILSAAECRALLRAVSYVIPFRNGIESRPMTNTTGEPGSGKSTYIKKEQRALAGSQANVLVTKREGMEDHFAAAVAVFPLFGIDNLDARTESESGRWFADFLASLVTGADYFKRKLFHNNTMYRVRLDSYLHFSSQVRVFRQRQMVERTILIPFLQQKGPDSEIGQLHRVVVHRPHLWAEMLQNLNAIVGLLKKGVGAHLANRLADVTNFALAVAQHFDETHEFISGFEKQREIDIEGDDEKEAMQADLWMAILSDLLKNPSVHGHPLTALTISKMMDNLADAKGMSVRFKPVAVGRWLGQSKNQNMIKDRLGVQVKHIDGHGNTRQYVFTLSRPDEATIAKNLGLQN